MSDQAAIASATLQARRPGKNEPELYSFGDATVEAL